MPEEREANMKHAHPLSSGYFEFKFEQEIVEGVKYNPFVRALELMNGEGFPDPDHLVLQVLRYVGPAQFEGVDKHLLLVSDGDLSMLASTDNEDLVRRAKKNKTCNFLAAVYEWDYEMIAVKEHPDGRFSYDFQNDVVAELPSSYRDSEQEIECYLPILAVDSASLYNTNIWWTINNPKSAYRKYMPFENIAPYRNELFMCQPPK